jgi:hypothetical protein
MRLPGPSLRLRGLVLVFLVGLATAGLAQEGPPIGKKKEPPSQVSVKFKP